LADIVAKVENRRAIIFPLKNDVTGDSVIPSFFEIKEVGGVRTLSEKNRIVGFEPRVDCTLERGKRTGASPRITCISG
jgi:hypothetical protein